MQKLLFAVLVGASTVCSAQVTQAPAAVKKSPALAASLLTLPVGTFECSTTVKPGKKVCDEIPVIVLFDGATCIAQLPYHALHISTDKTNASVVWKLIGPPGYKFADPDGITLIPKGGVQPSTVWSDPKRVSDEKYRWKIKVGALKGEFGHDAKVLAPDGTACIAGDPVIINDAN